MRPVVCRLVLGLGLVTLTALPSVAMADADRGSQADGAMCEDSSAMVVAQAPKDPPDEQQGQSAGGVESRGMRQPPQPLPQIPGATIQGGGYVALPGYQFVRASPGAAYIRQSGGTNIAQVGCFCGGKQKDTECPLLIQDNIVRCGTTPAGCGTTLCSMSVQTPPGAGPRLPPGGAPPVAPPTIR